MVMLQKLEVEAERASWPICAVVIMAEPRHTGILYLDDTEFFILHLPWHYRPLKTTIGETEFFFVQNQIDSFRLSLVAGRCRQIEKMNPSGVPYAFESRSECFDDQSQFLLTKEGDG